MAPSTICSQVENKQTHKLNHFEEDTKDIVLDKSTSTAAVKSSKKKWPSSNWEITPMIQRLPVHPMSDWIGVIYSKG